jgi:predicted CXXCH cytochrome family protein
MPCHSLRVVIAEGWEPGAPLADHFDPELLDTDAWTADGQLRAEAYEWTSFQMSRMAAAGVVCQDCHEPHAGRLRDVGNALCLGCHEGALGTEAHTHHPGTSAGSACVACHMPEHVFMERDRRRDHAFTRPDPTRARALGAPDACTACHRDRDREWAGAQVVAWYGPGDDARRATHALAVLLEAGRRGAPAVAEPLRRLLASDLDSIRRASAARFLAGMREVPGVVEALRRAAADREPFVRAAAVRALGGAEVRAALVAAARDARRLVRIEAAFALAGTSLDGLARGERAAVEEAFREWLAAQAPAADLPETHFNQGVFWTARGDAGKAEAAYRRALALWPHDLTPRQNLGILLIAAGRPGEAAREFEDLLRRAPTYPGAAQRLAEARLATGDERGAARAFEQATRDPTSRRAALRGLVRLAHRWNDQAMAARWLPEALLADPATANDPNVRTALGLPPAAPAGAPPP